MKLNGFTLIELLITLCILFLLITIATPNFLKQIRKAQVDSSTQKLVDAINTARSQAVFRNQRTVLLPKQEWHHGWILFVDANDDGIKNDGELLILETAEIKNIKISDYIPGVNRISFISSGEGRQPGRENRGAIIMGSIKVCPDTPGEGVKLVLNSGGRLRSEKINSDECGV